jgi:hypothetical protein
MATRQLNISIDPDLRSKVDRVPRSENVSKIVALLLRCFISTPSEMRAWAEENEKEAREMQDIVIETFERVKQLEAINRSAKGGEAVRDEKRTA